MRDWTDFPECPHCGEPDHDWWDGLEPGLGDGSKWTASCGECGKDYEVTMCIDTTFATRELDDE
jgi:hypothetical protein